MASTDLATLRVNVVAATKDFERGMGRVRKDTKSISSGFRDMRSQILGVTAAAVGIGFLAKKTFDVGAAVEETASKYRTVFGPAVDEVNGFIAKNARVMGQTDQQAQELLATTGAVAQGFGATKQASAELSVQIAALAADIASFNNAQGGAEAVARDVIGALGSEREALKKYGIVITETMVQQRAMEQTGKANAKMLTQLEKATATVALVTEKAGVAVGDLARTQDSAANTYRRIAASVRQFRDDIAAGLLPAMSVILGLTDDNSSKLEEWGRKFRESGPTIAAWARAAIGIFGEVSDTMTHLLQRSGDMGEAFRLQLISLGRELTQSELLRLNELLMAPSGVDQIKESWERIAELIRDAKNAAAGGLEGGLGGPDGLVLNLQTMTAGLNDMEQSIKNVATAFQDSLSDAIMGTEDAFKNFVTMALRELTKLIIKFAVFKGLTAAATGGSSGAADLLKILGLDFGGGKAAGGPVRSGTSYVVGEQGPELFTPQQSGNITPNGAAGMSLDFSNFPAPTNPLAMARDAEWQRFLRESLRDAQAGGFAMGAA